MVAKPKWVLSKTERDTWEQMVYDASKALYEERASPQEEAILAISKHLSLLEREKKEVHQIARLLQKAKKGTL